MGAQGKKRDRSAGPAFYLGLGARWRCGRFRKFGWRNWSAL